MGKKHGVKDCSHKTKGNHRPKRDKKKKRDLLQGGSALPRHEEDGLPGYFFKGHPYYSGRGGQICLH